MDPRRIGSMLSILLLVPLIGGGPQCSERKQDLLAGEPNVKLPAPQSDGTMSVEKAIAQRRSRRSFSDAALSVEEIGQLLWAAQGITDPGGGYRATPSAGALYPLEAYVVAGAVSGLEAGLYRYEPASNALAVVRRGKLQTGLSEAALHQDSVDDAPAVIVLTAVYARTAVKYGDRGRRYVHMEVGAAAENIYLQAESLGLATVFVGAFDDEEVGAALGLPEKEAPLALLPVGRRRQ
jgi:SagB-type dehydrogenase family enzyme